MSARAAFTISHHIKELGEATGFTSGSCMLCNYTTRDFLNDETGAIGAVVQHIAASHGRRRFKILTSQEAAS